MQMELEYGAIEAAELGYRIFPCAPDGKRPLIKAWPDNATSDIDKIRDWWAKTPAANVGLPTGSVNSIFVLDVDVKNDAGGLESLRELEQQFGPIPPTGTVTTPTGGLHFYFQYDGAQVVRNKAGFRPGLDIRGEGGYVVAPPSVIDGKSYTFRNSIDSPIAVAPSWLFDIIDSRSGTTKSPIVQQDFAGAVEGARNDTIFRYASSLIARGLPYTDSKELVLLKAKSCNPPLSECEATSCLDSAFGRYAPSRPLTELGAAERMVDRYGRIIRYLSDLGRWYVLKGHLWQRADLGEIEQLAKATVRSIEDEAKRETDSDKAESLRKFAKRLETSSSIRNILALVAPEPHVSIKTSELDADDNLFGLSNGVLDLRKGELVNDAPSMLVTKSGDVAYDPDATCPKWHRFLEDVTAGDKDLQEFLQRYVGYSMIGGNPEQKIFFLYGSGANGKSTFLRTVQRLFGSYSKSVENSLFVVQKYQSGGGPREDILRLRGARLVLSTELGEGQILNEELVKRMTGDDVLVGRAPYARDSIEFVPTFTPIVATNNKPIVRGDDHAIWRRIVPVPFTHTIPDKKRDRFLGGKLAEELPGILNWALEGCLAWLKDGDLRIPKVVINATLEYRSEMDLLEEWIDLCCEVGHQRHASARDLFNAYVDWCDRNNERWPLSKQGFGRKLSGKGFESCKSKGQRSFRGIGLKSRVDPLAGVRDISVPSATGSLSH